MDPNFISDAVTGTRAATSEGLAQAAQQNSEIVASVKGSCDSVEEGLAHVAQKSTNGATTAATASEGLAGAASEGASHTSSESIAVAANLEPKIVASPAGTCAATEKGLSHRVFHSKHAVAATSRGLNHAVTKSIAHAAHLPPNIVAAFAGISAAAVEGLSHMAFHFQNAAAALTHVAREIDLYARRNPEVVLGVTFGAGGLLILVVPQLLITPLLGGVGFGSMGPLAGSIAAGAQAGIGNVVAGGLFATLQSAAMGGYGLAIVAAVVQGVGAAAVAIGGAIAWFTRVRR